MKILKIKERIQVGDVFLLKFNCPNLKCKHDNLLGYPLQQLECCQTDVSEFELDIKSSRLVSGTRRKKKISKRDVQNLINLQGPYYAYCQKSVEHSEYHIDHIIPLAAGGSNNLSNLCIACPKCNLKAGSRVFSTFEGKRTFLLDKLTKN